MNRTLLLLVLLLLISCGGWWVWRYYLQMGVSDGLEPGKAIVVTETTGELQQRIQPVEYKVEKVVGDLVVPWSIVFTSPERMLVAERPGKVREVLSGELQPKPLAVFSEVSNKSEEGLMGMALDPNYEQNKYLYLCIAYDSGDSTVDKVIRVTDQNGTLEEEKILLDDIPAAQYHAGCRLRFGPDGKLYVSTGDATDRQLAQDLSTLAGKMLRLNPDGSIPKDNPYPNTYIYSFGHRNPQGFDWHPVSQTLIATEHGPSGFDGPGGGDEVNLIQPGANYGWPVVSHEESSEGMVDPLLVFTPAIAPASGMFYAGTVFPQFTNTYLFGMLKGEGILQVIFDESEPGKVVSYQKLPGITVGRVRDVVEGPDGFIYFTSSNRDSRGTAKEGDDWVYRLVPTL